MSDKETMALWERAFKTDPKFVKAITGKGYSGNSPSPYYIVRRLTEEFGPIGSGWGFEIKSERFERFSPDDALHICHLVLWYVLDGRRGEVEQMGQTMAAYRTDKGKGYLKVDEDAPKKSVTDALVKCASYLGFAGDIFSGRWDDSKYVASLREEFDEGRIKQRQDWLDAQKKLIMGATTGAEFKAAVLHATQVAMDENDSAAVDQINAWAEDKKAQAKPKPRGVPDPDPKNGADGDLGD